MLKRVKERKKNAIEYRVELKSIYMLKYYNIFQDSLDVPEMTEQEKTFFFLRAWDDGTIAAARAKNLDMVIFTPYATQTYDIYDYPKNLTLINLRGAQFIPSKVLEVDKDVCICFFAKNHLPIKRIVENYVNRIVNVEMVIKAHLNAQKCPFIIATSTQDKKTLEDLVDRLLNDEVTLFLDSMQVNALKNFNTTTPYIIDKLYQYKTSLENELLTYLGVDNNPIEKNERMLVDEVNANNALINLSSNGIIKNIKYFFKKINKIFGKQYTIVSELEKVNSIHEEKQETGEDDNVVNE